MTWQYGSTYETVKATFKNNLYTYNLALSAAHHKTIHPNLDNFVINKILLTNNGSFFTNAQIRAIPGMVVLTPYEEVDKLFQALLLSSNDKIIIDVLVRAAGSRNDVDRELASIDSEIIRLSSSTLIQTALANQQNAINNASAMAASSQINTATTANYSTEKQVDSQHFYCYCTASATHCWC
jgi:hypothetical protein